MEFIISIVSVAIALSSFLISGAVLLVNLRKAKIETINTYLQNERDPCFIEARKTVYNLGKDYDPEEVDCLYGEKISVLISFYCQAAIMVEKGYLPFSFFKQYSGYAVCMLYRILEPHIKWRREKKANRHPDYAKMYEWLYNRICKGRGEGFLDK